MSQFEVILQNSSVRQARIALCQRAYNRRYEWHFDTLHIINYKCTSSRNLCISYSSYWQRKMSSQFCEHALGSYHNYSQNSLYKIRNYLLLRSVVQENGTHSERRDVTTWRTCKHTGCSVFSILRIHFPDSEVSSDCCNKKKRTVLLLKHGLR